MNTSYSKGWLDNGVGLFVRAPDLTGHIYETAARDFNGCSKQRLWFHQARRRSPSQECAPSSWQKPRQCIEHLVDFQSKTPDTTHNTQSELTLKNSFKTYKQRKNVTSSLVTRHRSTNVKEKWQNKPNLCTSTVSDRHDQLLLIPSRI